MNLVNYTVRYVSDGSVTVSHFVSPKGMPFGHVILVAAGILFMMDCCPCEHFCVYMDNERGKPIFPGAEYVSHHYYGDDDSLWYSEDVREYTFGE